MHSLACFPPSQQPTLGSPHPGLKPAWETRSPVLLPWNLHSMWMAASSKAVGAWLATLCSNHLVTNPVVIVVIDPPGAPWGEAAPGQVGVSAGRQELAAVAAWRWGQGWPAPAVEPACVQIWAQHHEPGGFLSYHPQPGPNKLCRYIPPVWMHMRLCHCNTCTAIAYPRLPL